MRNCIHYFLPILLLTGCRNDRAYDLFAEAETVMATAPDSALRLLEGIDPAALDTRALRARHALLRSQALDKSGVDLKSDSIIAPAASFYARRGGKREKAYMYYYLGRIRNNAGRIGEAAEAMKSAERYALPCGETYLLGLIYNCRANLYYSQYSLDEALEMYDKADSCFRLEGKRVFSGYMAKAKATTYALQKNYSASEAEYRKALEIFQETGNHQQVCLISSSLAAQMKNHKHLPTSEIKEFLCGIYQRHSSGKIPSIDYPIWAWIYLHEDNIDSAKYFITKARKERWSSYDRQCGLLTLACKIEEASDNHKLAAQYWQDAYSLLDSISRHEKENLIQRIEERYENKELQHRNEMLHFRNRSYIFISALILIILSGIFFRILRHRQEIIRKQTEQNKKREAYIEELNEGYEVLKERYEAFIRSVDSRSAEEDNVMKAIEKRLTEMKELLRVAYSGSCNPRRLYDALRDYATRIKKEEDAFSDLRHVLNKRYNGFVDYFLGQHPKLTNTEKNMIYMLLYGFPSDSIRFIFEHENPETFYTRKYKLRKKLGIPSCAGDKFEKRLIEMAEEYKANI